MWLSGGNGPAIADCDVRHETFERSPYVGGPATAHRGRGPNERLIFRLPHVEKILEVGDDLERPELPHGNRHRIEIRLRFGEIRVVIQHLSAVVDPFNAEPIHTGTIDHQVATQPVTIE